MQRSDVEQFTAVIEGEPAQTILEKKIEPVIVELESAFEDALIIEHGGMHER